MPNKVLLIFSLPAVCELLQPHLLSSIPAEQRWEGAHWKPTDCLLARPRVLGKKGNQSRHKGPLSVLSVTPRQDYCGT